MTVEDFLRWSARTPQHKNQRFVDLSHNADGPEDRSSPVAGPSNYSTKKTRTRRIDHLSEDCANQAEAISSSSPIPPRKTPTLSSRMLRAAALSHVELDPDSRLSAIRGTDRQVLKFQTVSTSPTMSGSQPKSTKWRLVDPRRVSIPTASEFSTCSVPSSQEGKAVNNWKPRSTALPPTKRTSSALPLPASKKRRLETSSGGTEMTPSLTFVAMKRIPSARKASAILK